MTTQESSTPYLCHFVENIMGFLNAVHATRSTLIKPVHDNIWELELCGSPDAIAPLSAVLAPEGYILRSYPRNFIVFDRIRDRRAIWLELL